MKHLILSASILAMSAATPALAEMELSVYTGWQTSPHSRVKGTYPGTGASYDALIGWDGKSFEMPPYYGIRGTWWRTENVGFGVEFSQGQASQVRYVGDPLTQHVDVLVDHPGVRAHAQRDMDGVLPDHAAAELP